MSRICYIVGGSMIGAAGGIYLGAGMICMFMGHMLRQGGGEEIDEFFQILQECNEKRKQSR